MSQKLRFTKMQGAGNDFVMINGIKEHFILSEAELRFLADRKFGIGADQILLVERSDEPEVDFIYRIFNADGGEVEQCGNGARCFAVFVRDEGLTEKNKIRVRTMKGIIEPEVLEDGRVRVNMGAPKFDPQDLPFQAQGLSCLTRDLDKVYNIPAAGHMNWVSAVSMGNPHAVILVGDSETAAVDIIGPEIENHAVFPNRVNVGFLEAKDVHSAKLRVWERGAGETLACGTGACAAAVVGIRRGTFAEYVDVQMRGGLLTIEWAGRSQKDAPVYLTGPAEIVFKGEIVIPTIE